MSGAKFNGGIANGTGDAAGGQDLVNSEGMGISKSEGAQKKKKKKYGIDLRKIKGL